MLSATIRNGVAKRAFSVQIGASTRFPFDYFTPGSKSAQVNVYSGLRPSSTSAGVTEAGTNSEVNLNTTSLTEKLKSNSKKATKQRKDTCKAKTVQKVEKASPNENQLPESKKARRRKKFDRDASALKELLALSEEKHSFGQEPWKDNSEWGEDKLAPPSTSSDSPKFVPSSKAKRSTRRQSLPLYDRKIEGFLKSRETETLIDVQQANVHSPAHLAHGLDRVLFNPGIHFLQDPRSGVYNYSRYLQDIPDIKDFDFERLTPFVKSSRDDTLHRFAKEREKKFAGSTSSLTGLLSHIYFLISNDHPVNTSLLSAPFNKAPRTFTPGQRMAASVMFNYREGIYVIDSQPLEYDNSQLNILIWMGTLLEKFLTYSEGEFRLLQHSVAEDANASKTHEPYRYAESETFIMRSQLDACDSRLPGTGVFDIKTRAALPIRLDSLNFQENSGYQLRSLHGDMESFDKEYYDLIRSAFLKYSFQARIGNMDGVFVAYHNTARIFGFQYVPLEEMDTCLFGKKERGWPIFDRCVRLLEVMASEITECFPKQSVTCLVEKADFNDTLNIWVQPIGEHSEDNGATADEDRPIVQLDLSVDNYVDNVFASGRGAVEADDKPWAIHWKISRSSEDKETIYRNFKAAIERKYRPIAYPSGINADNLEDFLKNLGYGDYSLMPDQKHFIQPTPRILSLRQMARNGLEKLESVEEAPS